MRRYALRLLPELAAQAAARQSGGSAARNAAFDVLRTRGGASHPWQRVPAWPHGLTAAATAPSAGGARSASSFAAAGAAARGAVQLRYVVGVAGALAASQWEELTASVKLSSLALLRLGRDVAAAAAIVADYKVTLASAPPAGPERSAALSGCHERGAERLLQLCFKNGGIYTKLGQHIGQLDHLLPSEYVTKMRDNLLDRCPVSDYAEVSAIITEDLGSPPEALFVEFDPKPIASASLAQVHVARARDGRQLAVKVQHAGLRESCEVDIATIEMLVHGARTIFPDFNYQWLVEEIKENLPRELNFKHEASNAERCRANLASTKSRLAGRVHVPDIDHRLTSSRVLTMEYIDGARVTDAAALASLGVPRPALARLVAETFNEMIFIHGDVHCDPHAANMLVRRAPGSGRMQLVLLDHGLYRIIDDDFRAQYAALWRSLVFGDAAGIKEHATAMNAGDLYPLFAAMLTQRPWEQIVDRRIDHLALPKTAQDKELLQGYAQVYVREIGDLLLRMPRPLLLLLKTNDCLRAVDNALGSPLNTVVMTARECTRALSDIRATQRPGLRSWLASTADAIHVELIVAVMHAAALWAGARRALRGGGGKQQQQQQKQQQGSEREEGGEEGELPPLQALPAEFVAATASAAAKAA